MASGCSFRIGGAPMAEQQKWTCPQCSRMISPDDSIIFGHGGLSHLNCHRPRTLSAEERTLLFVYCRDHWLAKCAACAGKSRLRDLASDLASDLTAPLLSGRAHLCPWCRRDLTDSVRVHLYGCVTLPTEVLRRAQATREAEQRLVKQGHQSSDAADVLMRDAKAARDALRKFMQKSPNRSESVPRHG